MLLDKFNRSLDMLEATVSFNCQFNCRFCPSGSREGLSQLFETEHIIRFSQVMAILGLKKVRLIGNEPLLRKDILSLILGLAAIKPKLEISLSTNGLLLREMAEGLALSRLDRLFVSMPTMEVDSFGQITLCEGLEEILAGIEFMQSHHPMPITIRTP